MKRMNKLLAALCLALIACLVVPALAPASLGAPFSAKAAVAISKTKATMYNGKRMTLKVTGTKRTVRWSSTNTKVAKVSQKGVVTAVKVGKATINAQVGTKKLSCVVTVKSPLSADATKFTLVAGKKRKVTLTYKLNGGLSLASYDSSVVKCSMSPINNNTCVLTVRAVRAGKQTLTVKNTLTKDVLKIQVTVTKAPAPPPIVDKTAVTVAVGKTATVKVTWPYEGVPNMRYQWDSGLDQVFTCTWGSWNGTGWPLTIKGLKKGTGKVWLYTGDDPTKNIKAEVKVTIK